VALQGDELPSLRGLRLSQKHGSLQAYALRRVIAAGPGRGCWRLQFRSDVETQIQHPQIRLESLNAESRVVALCFDTSCVALSIGPRLFFPSRPEQCSTFPQRLYHPRSPG
jgi:hypothetical protein